MSVLESPSWYRVERLRPALRRHVQVHRHRYRGEPWYVLADPATGRQHRLDARGYALIAACDGERTVAEIWRSLNWRLGDRAPTQDQCIAALGQLHGADLLRCDVPPDTREIFERYKEDKRNKRTRAWRSPFFVRIPLLDPERLLDKLEWLGRLAFNRLAFGLWLALCFAGLVAAGMHWDALVADARASLLSPLNLLALALVYPLVKALHELGHALAVKRWGGEVHDTGIMLLVFMPVPYVDASAANAFASKRARMAVAAAGIGVELGLASLALFLWLNIEPGLVRTLALNVMAIGGISTLLFNGNPLLKFDGYYVLADWSEIPNLAGRANRYYGYLARRYLMGLSHTPSPATSAGERTWFAIYGLAAFAYRTFILVVILLFVADVSLLAAAVLGAWAIAGQILVPAARKLRDLAADPAMRERRPRALFVVTGAVAAILLLLAVPVPHRTTAQGIVFGGDDSRVRAGTDCMVERVLVSSGAVVETGTPLIQCQDPLLAAQLDLLEAGAQELRARHLQARSRDQNEAQIVADEIVAHDARLAEARARVGELSIRSPAGGVVHLPAAVDLPGRFVAKGELLGDVIDPQQLGVRVAVTQFDIALVRGDVQNVHVLAPTAPVRALDAAIARVVPGASNELPSAALSTAGGGRIVADPVDETGRSALEPHFLVDLELDDPQLARLGGGRVHVRFSHGYESLGRQWYRDLRRLLLRRLAV